MGWDKVVDIGFVLIGIPIIANALAHFTQLSVDPWGGNEVEELDPVEDLDNNKLSTMLEFEKHLSAYGFERPADGKISRLEFMTFLLVKNGILKMDIVKDIMADFDMLDNDRSGYISIGDLELKSQS